jgi:hypothetical protein
MHCITVRASVQAEISGQIKIHAMNEHPLARTATSRQYLLPIINR